MCGTLNSLLGDWLNHALYLYLCACHERTLATCQATGGWVWISSWLPRPLHPLRSSVSVLRVAGCADEHEPINLMLDEHDQSGGNNRKVRYMYMNRPNHRRNPNNKQRNLTCDESFTTQHFLTHLREAF